MARNPTHVILNEVKNLIESTTYKTKILRLKPQNDIATQPPRGEGIIGLWKTKPVFSNQVVISNRIKEDLILWK